MPEDVYTEIKAHFDGHPTVTVNTGRGAQGMKIGKKMFAMFFKGDLLLTMPPARVAELIESGTGRPYDPGTGNAMSNRVLITVEHRDAWISLSEEAAQALA